VSVVPAAWDAVVTCFFLDTAHNIVEYIEIISKILKDGGVSSIIHKSIAPILYESQHCLSFFPFDEMVCSKVRNFVFVVSLTAVTFLPLTC
jgi:hypothetical protein